MAKVIAPLMSMSASGTIGRDLTFFSLHGQNIVRSYVSPRNTGTTGQRAEQFNFRQAYQHWKTDTTFIHSQWINYANRHNLPYNGYALYIKAFIEFLIKNSGTIPNVRNNPPHMQ